MAAQTGRQIDTVMHESRLFSPRPSFSEKARIKSLAEYEAMWNGAAADPAKFWGDLAREELHWFEPFTETLNWNEPFAEWFVGGKTNASYNCLDAHVAAGHGNRVAICGRVSRAIVASSLMPNFIATSASLPTA